MEVVKREIMRSGAWHLGHFVLASGDIANNKLDLPHVLGVEHTRDVVLKEFVDRALRYEPEALWGVPTGGQLFAEAVAEKLRVPLIRLKVAGRDSNNHKIFGFDSEEDTLLAASGKRLVGIEDVTTKLGSINRTLTAMPDLQNHTSAIIAGWRRSAPIEEQELPDTIQMNWIVQQPIPSQIRHDDPLFIEFSSYAKKDKRRLIDWLGRLWRRE